MVWDKCGEGPDPYFSAPNLPQRLIRSYSFGATGCFLALKSTDLYREPSMSTSGQPAPCVLTRPALKQVMALRAAATAVQNYRSGPRPLWEGYSVGTPMFGKVTALEGLYVTGKYQDRSMHHTCSRHAAWDPHSPSSPSSVRVKVGRVIVKMDGQFVPGIPS